MRKQHTRSEKHPSPVPELLRQLLTAEGSRKRDLKRQLQRLLTDPRELLECGIIDSNHKLYRNALAVEDALESVSNGMENPAVMERLAEVPEDSIVGPWKLAVLALDCLYAGETGRLREISLSFPDSPPRRLVEAALRIAEQRGEDSSVSRVEGQFRQELLQAPQLLVGMEEQLEEALEMNLIDLFADTATMLLRDIERDYARYSPEFARWCFARLVEADKPLSPLIRRLKGVYGEAETLRLAALGVADEDADAAFLFWLRFMTASLREDGLDSAELSAALQIAAEIGEQGSIPWCDVCAPDSEETDDELLLRRQAEKLLQRIANEASLRHRELTGLFLTRPSECRAAAMRLSRGNPPTSGSSVGTEFPQESNPRPTAPVRESKLREPTQLELFA